MAVLAFAIVVGNVVTLTVFMQTRQSRTPQGYLKGKQFSMTLIITNVNYSEHLKMQWHDFFSA